jgi:phosphoethanolamine N-methyltransferase
MTDKKQVDQDFLDSSQYLAASILLYESVYGEDFVSPGGLAMAREMIDRMALAPGSRVLDVGCGLGGSAFVMARDFGLLVDGIDLSKNMLALANQKLAANGLSDSVRLEWGDCLKLEREDYYAAVYSRDVSCCSPITAVARAPGATILTIMLKTAGTACIPSKNIRD